MVRNTTNIVICHEDNLGSSITVIITEYQHLHRLVGKLAIKTNYIHEGYSVHLKSSNILYLSGILYTFATFS